MPRRVVVDDHVYEGADAERTIAAIPVLWSHYTHETASETRHESLGHALVDRLAALGGVECPPEGDVEVRLDRVTTALRDRSAALDDERTALVLRALWESMASFRDTTVAHGGRVERLFAGAGLPKPEQASLDVDWDGPIGDVRRDRAHHGRPHQALCIWSIDVIDSLASEGHPIAPGCAGENIAVSGLPWAAMRPGALVRLGSVLTRLTAYTTPCRENAAWFASRDFGRMSHERGDVSRLYAMVLEPGSIAIGDAVTLRSDR